MKKLITALFCSLIGGSALAQWTPTTLKKSSKFEPSLVRSYYKLDLSQVREKLKNAQETGKNAKAIEISLPTLNGKVERFAVYSFPVVVKELADQYQLGSYVGVGIDDPNKFLRFSVSPTDFQSMIINSNGQYEFIEPQNTDKSVYGVHPKTINTGDKSFICSTSESPAAKQQIDEMLQGGSAFTNQPTDFSKMSDKKYRTMRLAMSVTGEYTAFHGGTVAGALSAINATLTRVNGVFEKDFALHLNLQNFPNVIYTNAATDPYSGAQAGAGGAWILELQQTLSNNVGNGNYDIGHLFGASGGGGNAGCIGCVCINPADANSPGKGSGYTSPADNIPQGDNFDIDYVAHEMGHQLGANHTFSHALEPYQVNVEPGSGSTIMGYAGITGGAATDVQPHSNAYFHKASISQVQTNLNNKTCDVEATVANNPPVIAALPTYNIPKGTAFVLTASATDAENDPMTYTWEQVDNATVTTNSTNLGSTGTGPSFRSFTPTASPTRYFPKLASVLSGVLDNSNSGWESVSKVARTTKYAVTVRDNSPVANQQQTQFAEQTIVVGNEGPFKVNTQFVASNGATTVTWDVANTTAAPYNVANVKIDYTIDNGATWVILSNSTANDGSESFTFSSLTNGQAVIIRVSSIGNVFYAVRTATVSAFAACNGSAPTPITTSNITTSSVDVSWAPVTGATYVIRYKKLADAAWQQTTSSVTNITLSNLIDGTAYEVQVATVCSGTTGTYSPSSNFTTTGLTYCTVATVDGTDDHIAGVSVANMTNTSGPSTYTSYVANSNLQVNLVKNGTYTLSVTKGWAGTTAYPEMISAWIDFNRNGTFEDNERIMQASNSVASTTVNPTTANFTVPSSSVLNQGLRMRIGLLYYNTPGYIHNSSCGTINALGEYEDYNVVVTDVLSTSESSAVKNEIQIYPNPATDFLNITKVSDKATYKIYSAAGQLVGNGNISNGKINVSSLIKGAYVISIEDKGKESFNSKFIKK
ncbi:reprolysin-like metallopeptidase [Chryseobacterium indoltheticum]|uniref:Por secretion system C-terminal sorting domain n=1 Tax=Chryseobacterium indoltheticum TaxID=254 RepID=A0A381JTD0_9FLAO|nr:zinc-dependent metalloprotease family protein [Chryseobacterium indoltheticum]AZA75663.1 T9SS C-terminal target domain-containing protein [Chryseobacterium indoltheticum]SIQ46677.1 Por secretion system C-terminal sorting domain-containing protein [Chryseobacterium indoltheticum]SUY53794.1 Por secretion system C-terminal sorting domain [Chryseobacterium indoltheticum]